MATVEANPSPPPMGKHGMSYDANHGTHVVTDANDLAAFNSALSEETHHEDAKRAERMHKAEKKAQIHSEVKAGQEVEAEKAEVEIETEIKKDSVPEEDQATAARKSKPADAEAVMDNVETPEESGAAQDSDGTPSKTTADAKPAGASAQAQEVSGGQPAETMGGEAEMTHAPQETRAAAPQSGPAKGPEAKAAKPAASGAMAEGNEKGESPAKPKGRVPGESAAFGKAAKAASWISLAGNPAKTVTSKLPTTATDESSGEKALPEEQAEAMAKPSVPQAGTASGSATSETTPAATESAAEAQPAESQAPETEAAGKPSGTPQTGPGTAAASSTSAVQAQSDAAFTEVGTPGAKPEAASNAVTQPSAASQGESAQPGLPAAGAAQTAVAPSEGAPTAPGCNSQESPESSQGQNPTRNLQVTEAGSSPAEKSVAATQAPAQGGGEAYDYTGKTQGASASGQSAHGAQASASGEAQAVSAAPSAPESESAPSDQAVKQDGNNISGEVAPSDRAVTSSDPSPGTAEAQIPQARQAQEATQSQDPSHAPLMQSLQGGQAQPSVQAGSAPSNPVLTENDPNVVSESEGGSQQENGFAQKSDASKTGTSAMPESGQTRAVTGTGLNSQPQSRPPSNAGSELARDVMDMVGRMLVSANPWAPVQEIRLVLNSEVVPNTEIQMRLAKGAVDVNIISDNNESLELLGKAGAGLTKTLENATPGVVRVQLFNGNGESVRMSSVDESTAQFFQGNAQVNPGNVKDTPGESGEGRVIIGGVGESYDYAGTMAQGNSVVGTPIPDAQALGIGAKGRPVSRVLPGSNGFPVPPELPTPVASTTEAIETSSIGPRKTASAQASGSAPMAPKPLPEAIPEPSGLSRDVSDLVGRMLVSANPWAPVQEIRLVLNSEAVPNTEIQMRLESGRVDVNIFSDNDESLDVLGKAGGGLTRSLEASTQGFVRVQLFNGSGEKIEMPTGMGAAREIDLGLTAERPLEPDASNLDMIAPEPPKPHGPPAEDVMDMVDRLLQSAEPWVPLREIRMVVNHPALPNTEIHMRGDEAGVDVNIISSDAGSLDLLEMASLDLTDANAQDKPVVVRITHSGETELP